MSKPAFCASCIEERSDLTARKGKRGVTVWLCRDCDDPVGALRQYEIESDNRGGSNIAARQDGNRQRGTGKKA